MLRAMIDSPTVQRFLFFSMVVVALTMLVSFVVVRTVLVWQLRVEQGVLESKLVSLSSNYESQNAAIQERLDAIDRTLYSPPTPPPPVRRSSYVEDWMVNQNKEIQTRLRALEQWRYRMER